MSFLFYVDIFFFCRLPLRLKMGGVESLDCCNPPTKARDKSLESDQRYAKNEIYKIFWFICMVRKPSRCHPCVLRKNILYTGYMLRRPALKTTNHPTSRFDIILDSMNRQTLILNDILYLASIEFHGNLSREIALNLIEEIAESRDSAGGATYYNINCIKACCHSLSKPST
jgi:hypothetical protein